MTKPRIFIAEILVRFKSLLKHSNEMVLVWKLSHKQLTLVWLNIRKSHIYGTNSRRIIVAPNACFTYIYVGVYLWGCIYITLYLYKVTLWRSDVAWGSDDHVPRCGVSALVYVSGEEFVCRVQRERGTSYTMWDVNRRDIDINVILDEYCCIML